MGVAESAGRHSPYSLMLLFYRPGFVFGRCVAEMVTE
jgi:hypothetical protein